MELDLSDAAELRISDAVSSPFDDAASALVVGGLASAKAAAEAEVALGAQLVK